MKLIDYKHWFDLFQPFEKNPIQKETVNCLKEIYDVFRLAPDPPITFTLTRNTHVLEESIYIPKSVLQFQGKHLQYEAEQDGRRIFIHFIVKKESPKYLEYVKQMLRVLFVLNHFSDKTCAKKDEFHIYLYMTPLKKLLPQYPPIGIDHVNTGMNTRDRFCSDHEETNEIVIYREEDWFKVFIHESIHSFRLDFDEPMKEEIRELFSVNSDINLFEAYTEFWAKMINMLVAASLIEDDFDNVVKVMNIMIQLDKQFAIFQVVKILRFMDLNYSDLLKGTDKYKEETNVFAYFVLNMCLMNHYNDFMQFCKRESHTLLRMNRDKLHLLIDFFKRCHNCKSLLRNIERMEELKVKDKVLAKSLKMTLFELK
jgi:hypothetical protein